MSNSPPPKLPASEPNEPIVVQKYGGSSVADTTKLRRVAERIVATKAAGNQVVVVVSAMASTTDELLQRAREVSPSPSRRELDMLLSCGERASMALLAMAVSELGEQAVSLTGSQSGIMTNDRHSGASIIEVRPVRVADELARGKIVIVAGFQGVSYKREITTLGRGGSDTTAVALAAALRAEYCEICSDVDGIYSADPRVVEGAELLKAIASDEMLELAAHGAKVLHASCVEIAANCEIKLYACATAKDRSGGGGTRIDPIGSPTISRAIGVTGQGGLVCLRSDASRLLAFARGASLPVLHFSAQSMATGKAELWFALTDVPDWPSLQEELADDSLSMRENLAMVSVVGRSCGADSEMIRTLLTCAQEAAVEILATTCSPLRMSVFCAGQDQEKLVQRLHRQFCTTNLPR